MTPWSLPTSLIIGGVGYSIRTDYRAVLDVLAAFASDKYDDGEKWEIAMRILFTDWRNIPPERYNEAAEAVKEFIDAGIPAERRKKRPSTMDWEHDAPIILPAVNRVLGQEVRAVGYLHWWTFVGAYMEIGKSLFSTVVAIRQKRQRGEKLNKEEARFLRENQALVSLRKPEPEEDTTPAETEADRRKRLGKAYDAIERQRRIREQYGRR